MLKYQVRTLGRERRRQSAPLRDVFTTTTTAAQTDTNTNGNATNCSAPNSPWHDLSRTRGRSTSVSSLSSASTSSDTTQDWSTIRIYTSSVRPDTDYKTLFANANTTSVELIRLVLNKFRIHFKDPELFYLVMELTTKHEATEVRHAVALDSGAKPLVLQACYPADRCRFELRTREHFPIKIYDSSLCTTSNYKTLTVSRQTTCAEAVGMLLKTESSSSSPSRFEDIAENGDTCHTVNDHGIVLLDTRTRKEVLLHPQESIFTAIYEAGGQYQLHLCPLRRPQRVLEHENNQSIKTWSQRRRITPSIMPRYADDTYSYHSAPSNCHQYEYVRKVDSAI